MESPGFECQTFMEEQKPGRRERETVVLQRCLHLGPCQAHSNAPPPPQNCPKENPGIGRSFFDPQTRDFVTLPFCCRAANSAAIVRLMAFRSSCIFHKAVEYLRPVETEMEEEEEEAEPVSMPPCTALFSWPCYPSCVLGSLCRLWTHCGPFKSFFCAWL